MLIRKTRILSADFSKKFVINGKLYIGVPADTDNIKKIELDINQGETSVLPSAYLGVNCRRNADGEWIVDKSGEKEWRTVNTVMWTWQDWGGNEHSKWCDIVKECYPKHFIEPTLIEIQLIKSSNKEYLASIINADNFEQQKDVIKQTINMFLEIFGYCLLYNERFTVDASNIKRCQWEFLPQGERIWVTSQWHEKMRERNENCDDFYQYRLDVISDFSPNEVYTGEKGMTGYFAFVFDDFCIFENGKYGNATYITNTNHWQQLSQMTKQQLFATNNVKVRFIHHSNWHQNIRRFMRETTNS
jgi:hypothetical protein